MKVGIIGCGAIGTSVAKFIDDGAIEGAEIVAVFDTSPEQIQKLVKNLDKEVQEYCDFNKFLKDSGVEIVIETASQKAVKLYGEKVILSGKNMIILSVGALIDEKLLENIRNAAKRKKCKVIIPSGAIGGLDILKAAKLGGIERVVLTTRKHPHALEDSQNFQNLVRSLKFLEEPKVIFESVASKCVKAFPVNMNVAAILSLLAGDVKTVVRIIADPTVRNNVHEIEAFGRFGRSKVVLENVTHPLNPKTSYIAVLSTIEALRSFASEEIQIGT